MVTRRGRPRNLSQSQIQQVLDWFTHRQEWIARYGMRKDLAEQLNVSGRVIRRALEWLEGVESGVVSTGLVSGGASLELVPDALETVRAWWTARKNCEDMQLTSDALAMQLGVSRRYIYYCVRRYGLPKKARTRVASIPPRAGSMRARVASSKDPQGRSPATDVVSDLFRTWRAPSVHPRPRRRR